MKKILSIAVAATAMLVTTACVSEDRDLMQNLKEAGKGYIALNVTNDDALTTRTIFSTSPREGETSFDASTWTVSISGSTSFNGTVSQLSDKSFNAAEGYTATVSNYANLAAALKDNTGDDSFGKAFYQGTSESFKVTSGNTSNPSINCGKAQNAKLSIDVSAFSNVTLTSLTISGSDGGDGTRIVEFYYGTTDNTSKVAYFKAEDALTYSIKYKAANNEEKEITNNTPLKLNAHTSNTLRLTSNATGLITLTISYDDTFDEGQTVVYNIDSATGAQL